MAAIANSVELLVQMPCYGFSIELL